MSRGVKTTLVLSAIFVSLAVTLFAWRQKTTGGSANNGYTGTYQKAKKERPVPEAQIDKSLSNELWTAIKTGDEERANRIMQTRLTPAQRGQIEEKLQGMKRGGEVTRRAQSILGEQQYRQLLVAKKSWAVEKKSWARAKK